jgi:hypothetical protein
MRLKDKVAIVTGAAKGLGREFSIGMAREGAKIMAVTRKVLANLEKLAPTSMWPVQRPLICCHHCLSTVFGRWKTLPVWEPNSL